MQKIFSLFLFFIHISSFAQNIQILSKEDSTEVPYANIVYFANDSIVGGIYTNSDGKASLNNVPFNTNFIEISCVGYQTLRLETNNIVSKCYLQEDVSILEEVLLTSKKVKNKRIKSKKMGYSMKRIQMGWSTVGGLEIITLIKNNLEEKKKIKSFLFRLAGYGNISRIFRIVFYKNDNGNIGKPYFNHTKQNKFIFNLQENQKIVKLDIDYLDISIPKEGVFIGLEYLGHQDNETKEKFDSSTWSEDYYTAISLLKSKNETASYTYAKSKFNEKMKTWRKINDNKKEIFSELKENEYYVPAFGIEVYE